MTPAPASLMMPIISSTSSPGIVICGKAATFWKYRNHGAIPKRTSSRACSSVSAMCMGHTSDQFLRSTVVPNAAARSSAMPQWKASASNPSTISVAPIDSRPMPCLPASRAPVGEATAATDSGMPPSEYGASCSWASCSSCVAVLAVTVSPASSRTRMSRLVSSSSRVSVGVRPIIDESVGSEPGPTPPMIRPWVRWSSSISRSAAHSGL